MAADLICQPAASGCDANAISDYIEDESGIDLDEEEPGQSQEAWWPGTTASTVATEIAGRLVSLVKCFNAVLILKTVRRNTDVETRAST
eukprot:symbB.v1.2.004373.t1/scaffold240.1/size264318/29